MENLASLGPCELIVLAALFTIAIADDLDSGELNVLGNFISAVGSLVSAWAAQKEQLATSKESADSNTAMEELKNQIQCLQDNCNLLEQRLQHK